MDQEHCPVPDQGATTAAATTAAATAATAAADDQIEITLPPSVADNIMEQEHCPVTDPGATTAATANAPATDGQIETTLPPGVSDNSMEQEHCPVPDPGTTNAAVTTADAATTAAATAATATAAGMVVEGSITKACRVDVKNCGEYTNYFPSSGFYTYQAALIRENFFPGEQRVTLGMVKEARLVNPRFAEFFDDLVAKKASVGCSRSPHLEAVNSMTQVLRTPGGGNKMRAGDKEFFIEIVGDQQWGLALKKELLANEPNFREKYSEFCKLYKNNHVADVRIREVIKEDRKKREKKRTEGK